VRAHCHVEGDFASDAKYTKVVSRRMIQMVRHLNSDWQSHIANTGVTCYTCHRGNPVPKMVWFKPQDRKNANSIMGDLAGQNSPAKSVGYSSLPFDPFTPYLLNAQDIRVNGNVAIATKESWPPQNSDTWMAGLRASFYQVDPSILSGAKTQWAATAHDFVTL
jgi:photosynthetic reaction center cytochrome c subunit